MSDLSNNLVDTLTGNLSLTENTNLFEGGIVDIKNIVPDYAVFVKGIGGVTSDKVFQLTYEIAKPQVSIYVRSAINARQTGIDKLADIYEFLISNLPTGYLRYDCLQSEPQELGKDDKGRWVAMMTFEYWREDIKGTEYFLTSTGDYFATSDNDLFLVVT